MILNHEDVDSRVQQPGGVTHKQNWSTVSWMLLEIRRRAVGNGLDAELASAWVHVSGIPASPLLLATSCCRHGEECDPRVSF